MATPSSGDLSDVHERVRGYEVRIWQDISELRSLEYARYWNNEEIERGKEWWILDGDFARMEAHLERSTLAHQLDAVFETARDEFGFTVRGTGADLAAGNLWALPRLVEAGPVDRIFAVEYSEHRLLKLGPVVLEHHRVDPDRVVLCLGSFYDLQLPDSSLDFVLLSQALHHADRPIDLLREVARVLRPDGVVLVIGEHVLELSGRAWLRDRVGRGHQRRDGVLGDHWYTASEYRKLFERTGFRYARVREDGSAVQGFALAKKR